MIPVRLRAALLHLSSAARVTYISTQLGGNAFLEPGDGGAVKALMPRQFSQLRPLWFWALWGSWAGSVVVLVVRGLLGRWGLFPSSLWVPSPASEGQRHLTVHHGCCCPG